MSLSLILLALAGVFYLAAFLFHLMSFSEMLPGGHRPAFVLMRIGFLISTFYFAAEAIEQGFFVPVANLSQAMAFFAWSLAFVYLVLLVRIQNDSFGLVLTPILLLLDAVACVSKFNSVAVPVKPLLRNPYFVMHIVSAFFAYASFTLSFAAGILYLVQYRELKMKHAGKFYHKLPPLEGLESLIYQPLSWGVPLLAAAVGIGFLWSKSVYGEFWIFDPKTIATVITSALYLGILYLRYVSSLRGKQVAVLSLIAFGFVVFSFLGTRFIQGSHNFLQ